MSAFLPIDGPFFARSTLQQYVTLADPPVTRGGSGPPRRDETRRDDARHGATRGMEFDEEEARRDDAFYDELERAYIAELEHVRAGGVDLTEAILREEVYERLIGELEREDVSSDARDAVASFLQDLRRDGVEWHSIGHGRGYF